MIPVRVDINVDSFAFASDEDFARSFPSRFRRNLEESLRRYRTRLLSDLLMERPPLPRLPFVWSRDPRRNAKARAWYFANKVARGSPGGRYARTGTLQRAWRLEGALADAAGTVTLANIMPGADYVIGSRQVPGHKGNWKPMMDRVLMARTELEILAIGAFNRTLKEE